MQSSRIEPAPAPQEKPRRKPGSFVLKLTLSQFFRTLWLLLRVDLLVVLLFAGLVFFWAEHTVRQTGAMPQQKGETYAALHPALDLAFDTEPGGGLSLHHRVEEWLGLPAGATRRLSYSPEPATSLFWGVPGTLQYHVSVPLASGRYALFALDLGGWVRGLAWGLPVLLGFELLMLISSTIHVRRATRSTLAPIQQLAAAAQSIGVEKRPVSRQKPAPAPEELQLSGTIDTLNRITAKQLDTRISIEDERVELRDLAAAINSMLDRLDAAYNSQLRFVSDASHELRTPIAVIQGYANLLDRWGKEDPEALQESIDAIKAEAEGMKTLVEQLLFLARSDNNSIVMQENLLDISALAEEVVRETVLIDPGHAFSTAITPGLWVEGDSGLLKQALRIFVDNAVKYSPPGEHIRVGTDGSGAAVRVWVSDNGIGIPAQDLPHVFERFYRSDESRARTTGGTGLGLSIAKWTIQRHNGHVEILSRPDIGTRLTMVLPAAQSPALRGDEPGTA